MESVEHLEREESKSLKELDRANRARAIFDDELFGEAVDVVKQEVWQAFASSDPADDEARRNAYFRLDALNRLLSDLRKHVETGKMAEQQLGFIRAKLERFKRKSA